jgi:hypothetical protein
MAIKLSLEKLPENLQTEVLTTHPNFHSYGFEARQEALKPFHRRNQQAESKRSNEVVKALRKNQATRKLTEALDKPAETPVVKPASTRVSKPEEKATRLASTTQLSEDRSNFRPASEIRQLLPSLGASEVSVQAQQLMKLAGHIEDHISKFPVSGSDDPESASENSKENLEPKSVRTIRKHLSRFYDAINKHNEYHTMAEYPAGNVRSSSVIRGQRSEVVERPGNYGPRVAPEILLTHRPLAKELIGTAGKHLGSAGEEFEKSFPEAAKPETARGLPIKEAADVFATHYKTTHLGKITPDIKETAKSSLLSDKDNFNRLTEFQQQQAEKRKSEEGLHKSQLTDEAQADLEAKHPNFESYPETDEQANVFQKPEGSTDRHPSKDSILKQYQAEGRFKVEESASKVTVERSAYEQARARRTPEEAFGLLLGGMRNARKGRSVDKRISEVEHETSKARLAKEAENAPEEDPNAKDKYGFTEQQHYDAFEAAHHHFMANNRGDYKTYLKSTAYTHPAAYLADNLTPQKRGGRGGSMAAFRGED